MLGKEECTSPSGYYELNIPVNTKLQCSDPKMRDSNCKDLDVSVNSFIFSWTILITVLFLFCFFSFVFLKSYLFFFKFVAV